MQSLILAILISASGDPLVRWQTAPVTLSAAQRTTLGNHITTKWPSVAIADVAKFECDGILPGCPFACRPATNVVQTGAAIRSLLLSGQPWDPGQSAGTQLYYWPAQCYAGSAMTAVRNFAAALAAETSGNELLSVVFTRSGSNVTAIIEYKRPMSAADCATYSYLRLEPMGVAP